MGSPQALSQRDLYVADLLPQVLDFCDEHELDGHANEIAVCDLCANKIFVLIDRYDEPDDILH